LRALAENLRLGQRFFVGVTDPIDPRVETPEEVRDRVLDAADFIPRDRLGTTDDCGFSPFGDDTSTSREMAFAKIRARLEGTELAARRSSRRSGGRVAGHTPARPADGLAAPQCRRRARSAG
jgi:5-methyltetrahydropteroyltriglutamate--homocysteine methyltransferase